MRARTLCRLKFAIKKLPRLNKIEKILKTNQKHAKTKVPHFTYNSSTTAERLLAAPKPTVNLTSRLNSTKLQKRKSHDIRLSSRLRIHLRCHHTSQANDQVHKYFSINNYVKCHQSTFSSPTFNIVSAKT